MKLKINPDPQFKADVSITVPGQSEPGTISLTFKYRGRDEYKALLEDFEDKTKDKKNEKGEVEKIVIKKGKTFVEAFPEFVLGWDLDEKFTPENIKVFLNNYPAAYQEIFAEYLRLLFASRVKN